MCVQLKRCSVVWSCVLQSGQSGEVVMFGSILCLYAIRKGDFPVLSWASVLRVLHGSDCSVELISGGVCLMILLCSLEARWFCTVLVCIVLIFSLIVSSVVVVGSVSRFKV